MADCELCTLAKPTLVPFKVAVKNIANPEGAYKGLCLDCLEACEQAYQEYLGKEEEEKEEKKE